MTFDLHDLGTGFARDRADQMFASQGHGDPDWEREYARARAQFDEVIAESQREVAAKARIGTLREAAALIRPMNPREDWTEYAEGAGRAADELEARADAAEQSASTTTDSPVPTADSAWEVERAWDLRARDAAETILYGRPIRSSALDRAASMFLRGASWQRQQLTEETLARILYAIEHPALIPWGESEATFWTESECTEKARKIIVGLNEKAVHSDA